MIGQRILQEILGRKQNLQGFPHLIGVLLALP